jgi:hypothetical protein
MPAPRKRLLFQESFTYPLATLLVLAAVFLFYYVLYTGRHEATLDARAFRGLAAAGDGVQSRIQALATVFGQVTSRPEFDKSLPAITEYLATQAPHLRVGAQTPTAACAGAATLRAVQRDADHFIEFSCGPWAARVLLRDVVGEHLTMTPPDTFDEVLVADDRGEVLYQPAGAANRIRRIPRVRTTTAAADAKPAEPVDAAVVGHHSSLGTIDLSGRPYRLYVIPVETVLSATGMT